MKDTEHLEMAALRIKTPNRKDETHMIMLLGVLSCF